MKWARFTLLPLLLCACGRAIPVFEGDLTPERAVELAVANSPEPALARYQRAMQSAERNRVAAESSLKVGLGAMAAQQNASMIYNTGGDPNFYQTLPSLPTANFNLMAMLPLFNGGLFEHRLAAAESSERALQAREELALRRTALAARLAFFETARAQAEEQTQQEEVTARLELQKQAQKRFEIGREARFVVLRAEAEVAAARQKLRSSQGEREQRESALRAALGISWKSAIQLTPPTELPSSPLALNAGQQEALSQRPDLLAARLAIEEGDQRLLAAVAESSPKLSLVAMGETMRVASSRWESGYSVGLSLSFPIFDGGLRRAGEEVAEADLELRKAQLRQLEIQVEQEVSQAYSGLTQALETAQLSQIELEKAQEELRIARLRFDLGRAIYLEVLDSLALVSRARTSRLAAQYAAHQKHAEYLYAIGRLP